MHCIYKITNTKNGKYYVGRTKDFPGRKYKHFSCLRKGKHWNPKLQNAFDKWGEESFRMDVEVTGLTKPQAKELEQLCLDEVVGMPRCYNISKSADAPDQTGYKHSEESRRKNSEAQKISWSCPERRRRQSEAHLGKTLSEEHKRKIGVQSKIAMNRPETIRKQRLALGKPFTVTWPDGRVTSYLSSYEAAADLGTSHGTIQKYLKGKRTPGNHPNTAHLKGCVFTYCEQ